jgi:hypothetical protein
MKNCSSCNTQEIIALAAMKAKENVGKELSPEETKKQVQNEHYFQQKYGKVYDPTYTTDEDQDSADIEEWEADYDYQFSTEQKDKIQQYLTENKID